MKEGKTYIGIDPGSKGFVSVLYDTGERDFCDLVSNNYHSVADFLRNVSERSKGRVVCCMEEIHAVFGSSAKGTFSFGEVYGVLQGILVTLKIPYHLVSPRVWQKEMRITQDIVYSSVKDSVRRKIDNKPTSINTARRLFPDVDFRRTEKCKKEDDNKCDATLICEYGRRKNL